MWYFWDESFSLSSRMNLVADWDLRTEVRSCRTERERRGSLNLNECVAAIIKTSYYGGVQMESGALAKRHDVAFTPANQTELNGGGLNRSEMNWIERGRKRERDGEVERTSQSNRACNRVLNGALTWVWPHVNRLRLCWWLHELTPCCTLEIQEGTIFYYYYFLPVWSNGFVLSSRKSIHQQSWM